MMEKKLTAQTIGELADALPVSVVVGVRADSEIVASDDVAVKGRTLMDYGDSGDGKSTRMHSLARWYFSKTGLPVRLVAAEDSSKMVFQDLIDAGIVQAVFLNGSKTELITYERIAEGEWPLPGQFEETRKAVKQGGKDAEVVKRVQKWQARAEWEGTISAYIFEGLSSICENALNHVVEDGRLQREQKDNWDEGGRNYSAASQSAYGFVQSFGIKLLRTAGALPVDRVAWTAHEAKGKDEFEGGAVRGPKLVGAAATNTVRKYVGVLLHTERMPDSQIRVYFENHADKTAPAVQWKAKVTVAPSEAGRFRAHFKDGFFVPTLPKGGYKDSKDGLIPFLELEEKVRAESHESAKQLKSLFH